MSTPINRELKKMTYSDRTTEILIRKAKSRLKAKLLQAEELNKEVAGLNTTIKFLEEMYQMLTDKNQDPA